MSDEPQPEYLQPRDGGGRIELAEWAPGWAESFQHEAARIRAAVGSDAVGLHHVGSTSVPGLAAKPILDILLLVPDSSIEDTYAPALQAIGYTFHLREPHWHEHRVFKRGQPKVNLHVFSAGSSEAVRMLAFRDWLRNHPDDRNLYLATKRELAARPWVYVQDYADAKSAVVEEILQRAAAPPRE
jgi:GrpB-like predicted nucleotidyltransferase (UPF0157 family)